jgi:hypothetical protein
VALIAALAVAGLALAAGANAATVALQPIGNGAGVVTGTATGVGSLSCSLPAQAGDLCSFPADPLGFVQLEATPAPGSTFAGWTGCPAPAGASCDFAGLLVPINLPITATFVANTHALAVTLTGSGDGNVSSSPAGIDCGADCAEQYPDSTAVTLTPTPSLGSTFVGWGGACAGTGACVVNVTSDVSITAQFEAVSHLVTVGVTGSGNGYVSSSPGGIACGPDCSELYAHGTVLTLTANPSPGSYFVGWGGSCVGAIQAYSCVIDVTSPRSVTAHFGGQQPVNPIWPLTVGVAGPGNGTVVSSPGGIACGSDCSDLYADGAVVTLTANPSPGSGFAGWSGACGGQAAICTVTMHGARTATASFTLYQQPTGGSTVIVVDTIGSSGSFCDITGTPGDDVLRGTPGDDVICALGGDDVIYGLGGDDDIRGGAGRDLVYGGGADDVVRGGSGDDRLSGGSGQDALMGGYGWDYAVGGTGRDSCAAERMARC